MDLIRRLLYTTIHDLYTKLQKFVDSARLIILQYLLIDIISQIIYIIALHFKNDNLNSLDKRR